VLYKSFEVLSGSTKKRMGSTARIIWISQTLSWLAIWPKSSTYFTRSPFKYHKQALLDCWT
jgi:hypothetical protein